MMTTVVADRTVQADVDEAMRVTHDKVIAMTGPLRRSGVRWTLHPGEEGTEFLDSTGWDDGGPEYALQGAHMRTWLRNGPDPVLVVAYVLVDVIGMN